MFSKINKAKFLKRALSALVLAPVAIGVIWYGGWPFLGLIVLCAALATLEWVQLALKTPRRILTVLSGLVYIALAFMCCYWIRADYTPQIALLFISMIWMSDICAYLFGQVIGGPKMASQISPNKTWAGLLGAVLGPALACLLFLLFVLDVQSETNIALFYAWASLGTGIAIGIVGQAGDLIVSFIKRQAGAKDTGQLIPGHGGLLDRIDSMMLAAPVFLLIVSKVLHV